MKSKNIYIMQTKKLETDTIKIAHDGYLYGHLVKKYLPENIISNVFITRVTIFFLSCVQHFPDSDIPLTIS